MYDIHTPTSFSKVPQPKIFSIQIPDIVKEIPGGQKPISPTPSPPPSLPESVYTCTVVWTH